MIQILKSGAVKAPNFRIITLGLALALLLASAAPVAAEPPLVAAAKAGDLPSVTALLEAGATPDAHDRNRNTALIFAARDGRLEIARALIAAGADVNWQDGERVTPLILAAHKNHPGPRAPVYLTGAPSPPLLTSGAGLPWTTPCGAVPTTRSPG